MSDVKKELVNEEVKEEVRPRRGKPKKEGASDTAAAPARKPRTTRAQAQKKTDAASPDDGEKQDEVKGQQQAEQEASTEQGNEQGNELQSSNVEPEQTSTQTEGSVAEQSTKESELLQNTKNAEIKPFIKQSKISTLTDHISIKELFKEWRKDQILIAERKQLEKQALDNGEELQEWDNPTTMRFDEVVQRNEVWTEQQKSNLIHSALYGYYIPPVLVKDAGDGRKWFLDGKQRITTFMTFLNGDWALTKKTEDVYGHNIAGCKFKDLPEDMQDEIYSKMITVVYIKNLTNEERDNMFVRLNGGSPLTKMELTRAKHSELIESVNELANLTFFKEDLELSKKARVRFVDQEIILQTAMLIEEGKDRIKGFGAVHIEDYVLRLKSSGKTISDEMIRKFEELSTYVNISIDKDHAEFTDEEAKKSLKKIHVPIIFYVADIAIKEKLQPALFGQFIRSFLVTNYSVESKYGKSCQSSSSKKESVITRIDEMTNALNGFIKLVRNSESINDAFIKFDERLAEINGIQRDEMIDEGQAE